MTLDEAIRWLEVKRDIAIKAGHTESAEAEGLGIEALKRVKWHKDQHERGYYELLPGETEE